MKKKFWETTVGKIAIALGKVAIGMIIKNQKGIKGTENTEKVDEVLNKIP